MARFTVITPPAFEPISTAEAAAYLKLETDADLARVAALVRAAREACTLFTGQTLLTQSVRFNHVLMGPRFYFEGAPLQSLDALTVLQGAAETVLDPADHPPCEDGARTYITLSPFTAGTRVIADYTLGFGPSWNDVPEGLRLGILRLVAHQYELRGGMDGAPTLAGLPHAVRALWQPHKRISI